MYSYYVLEAFLQYTVGDVFTDIITLSNSEALGYALSAYIYVKHSSEGRRLLSYSLWASSVLCGVMLLVQSVPSSAFWGLFLALLLMALRMSLSMCFNALMMITFTSFPTIYLCSVYAIINVVARICGIMAPTATGEGLFWSKIAVIGSCLVAGGIVYKGLDERKNMILRN